MNKTSAGYHMLMILSHVDGTFAAAEAQKIVDFLNHSYPLKIDENKEKQFLDKLPREDFFIHFNNSMNDFYEDSSESDRISFLKFAVDLVTADEKITVEENKYLKELFFAWDSQYEE